MGRVPIHTAPIRQIPFGAIDDALSMMHQLDVLENVLATAGPFGVKRPLHVEAAEASLANIAEFAAIRRSWWQTHQVDLLDHLQGTIGGLGDLAGPLLRPGPTNDGEVHEVPCDEGWEPGDSFLLFQERFKTAMVNAGAPSPFSYGVVGALNEMASNAIEHAAAAIAPVATFEVRRARWCFSVTDLGIGVLGSLKRNVAHSALNSDVVALKMAVRDGVSATAQAGRGFGFTQVFKSLAERSCTIRFRTTRALASWDGISPAAQYLKMTPMPARLGFHVAVSGSLAQVVLDT